jgi:hypothetical protein
MFILIVQDTPPAGITIETSSTVVIAAGFVPIVTPAEVVTFALAREIGETNVLAA